MTSHVDRPPCLKKKSQTSLEACVLVTTVPICQSRHEVCSRAHVLYSNISRGLYSRAATILFNTSGGAATIRERRLIEQIRYLFLCQKVLTNYMIFFDVKLLCSTLYARLSLVPGAEEERLVHTDALPVN